MIPSAGPLFHWVRTPPGLTIAATLAVALAVAAAVVLLRRWRRESPEAIECARRLRLHAIGRIASGELLDLLPADATPPDAPAPSLPPTVVYQYEVGGVTYQVSQDLHLVPVPLSPACWIPGWPVQVKYDPANPGNSIVVCEHWSGLPDRRAQAATAR